MRTLVLFCVAATLGGCATLPPPFEQHEYVGCLISCAGQMPEAVTSDMLNEQQCLNPPQHCETFAMYH